MQRYKLNLKSGTYTEGDAYQLNPIYRQQVVPAQTVNIDAQINLKTAALTTNIVTPSLMSVWFFYVPHRLVWDEWPDFISKQENPPTFPTTSKVSYFFEHSTGSDPVSALYRRAYKLVYNEYFGTESIGQAHQSWYDDITADSVIDLGRTRNPEDFASKLQLEGAVTDPEFTVSGSAIPLNDFYRQLMNARSQQRSQMTGDKYVDTLARMGVDASWMISERPEFLGTKSKMIAPQLTANTSNTNTGEETARFACNLEVQIKGKHFAEHGYIIGVSSVRPMLIGRERGSMDTNLTGIDDFYSADNLETKDIVVAEANGFTGDDAWAQRFSYLKNGAWNRGNGTTWMIPNGMNSFSDLIYPDDAQIPIGDELGTKDYCATTSVTLTGNTPVPKRVA